MRVPSGDQAGEMIGSRCARMNCELHAVGIGHVQLEAVRDCAPRRRCAC